MKKSRIVLLLAVVALILLSGTTGLAAGYSGQFYEGYYTTQSVSIGSDDEIYLNTNWEAMYLDEIVGHWYYSLDGVYVSFRTTPLCNGVPFKNSDGITTMSLRTYSGTDHYFHYYGTVEDGTGTLRFDNDYTPWTDYKLRNAGNFY